MFNFGGGGLFNPVNQLIDTATGGASNSAISAAAPAGAAALTGGLGGGIATGLLSFMGQERANSQNQASAREQMEFQNNMSSTAHQRQVKDLMAAGLNPILSANSGASSPSGASSQFLNSVGAGVASAQQQTQINDNLKTSATNRALTQAQQTVAEEQAKTARNSAIKTQTETELLRSQLPEAQKRGQMWQKHGDSLLIKEQATDVIDTTLKALGVGGYMFNSAKDRGQRESQHQQKSQDIERYHNEKMDQRESFNKDRVGKGPASRYFNKK